MTLRQLFLILNAHKRWVIVSIIAAVALAAVALLIIPKRYRATASVVVNGRAVEALYGKEQAGASSLATQLDIIKRPRIARQVVKDLGLDRDEAMHKAWQESGSKDTYEGWAAAIVGGGLTLGPAGDSSVIEIQYVSPDPEQAAKLANAFAKAYVATALELRIDPARQFVTFFDARIADLRKQLEAAQGRLSAFEKKTGLVNSTDKVDMENTRLNELAGQLAAAQSQQADANSKQSGVGGNAAQSPEVMANPLIQQLKSQVASQQIRLRELSLRLGPNHPQYQRAQGELGEMQARLNSEIGQVVGSLGASQRVSGARVAELRTALDTQRQRVLSLQGERDQADVLHNEVLNAQRAYDTVMQRQSQTLLESQAQQSDVSLLDVAYPPTRPFSPNPPLILTLGLFAGMLIGLLIAFLREYVSPLVRGTEDLSYYTGVPVLIVLPPAHTFHPPRRALGGMRNLPALQA